MQRIRIHTAGKYLARSGLNGIVSPGQAGDRIEQNHYVMAAFDHTFRLFEYHFGHLHMTRRLLVECRGDHLRLHMARHFGHLLGAFVDQQYDQIRFGVVIGNRIGDRLQQHRLTCFGLCHDQAALSLAYRCEKVDYTR